MTATSTESVLPPGVALAQRLVTPLLSDWVSRLGAELGRMCGYQLGLCDANGAPVLGDGGKMIRPALALMCSAAAGADPADSLPAGAAVELLHNASLIHDDIMDGDRERRHRPTAWVQFGLSRALLAGDALIALGFEVLASSQHPATALATRDLATTLRRLAIGQDRDLRFEGVREIKIADCLAMLEGKTGALMGCACQLGAYFASAPSDWAERFGHFGGHLGLAFQLVDDVLGIWGDPSVTGKPVGSDLRARKKSAPVVAAMQAGTAESARLAKIYATDADLTEAQVTALAELIEQAGGREWALNEAGRRVSAAWDFVDGLDLVPEARTELTDLTTALLTRGH